MNITVNGDARDLPEGTTVGGLLTILALPVTRSAVERNRTLVRRADHATTVLTDGDVLEIVTLVGGG
jgi:sulfur carrier protein